MLIFSIDSTVLNNKGEWLPELKEYLNELNEKGCFIAFNTSRYPLEAKLITDQLDFKPWLCTNTGGLIVSPEGKVISKVPISEEYFKEYLDSIFDTGYNFAISVYDYLNDESFACTENLTDISRIGRTYKEIISESTGLSEAVSKEDLYKILLDENRCILSASLIGDEDSIENLKEMRNVIENATSYHIGFDILYTTTSAEVVSKNHSKGSAVKRLREKINPNTIVSIGADNLDISAFSESDISIAVRSNDSRNNAWKNATYVVDQGDLIHRIKVLEKKGLIM